jgi:hypothetical protein
LDESKSSDYNIGMFDEDRHNDIMVSKSGNKEKISPDSYHKLVESRGAFLLRGAGPPITGNRHVVSSKGVEERNQLLTSSSLNSNISVANSNNNNSVNDLSGFNVDPGSNDMSPIKSNSKNNDGNDNRIRSKHNASKPGMRVSMHVPKSSLRTRDNLSHKGWIKRRGGYGIFGKWKRQFLSLWRNSILYFHRDDASSDKFYNGNKSKNNAKGEINLRDIVGVRMATKKGLPGDGRGIELVSSSGKVTTICPEGGGNIFMDWYNKLRNIIGNLNRGRYQRTGDPEYRKDVSEINPRQFGKGTMNDIQSSLNDVDSYNVDVWDLDESKSSDYNIGMFDKDKVRDVSGPMYAVNNIGDTINE